MRTEENQNETQPTPITPFMILADLWTFAEVADCTGNTRPIRSCGPEATEWYQAVCEAARARLAREQPQVSEAIAACGGYTLRGEAQKITVRYAVAEYFEEFGDTTTALRLRRGTADELLHAVSSLATTRLTRALTVIAGPSLGDEWGGAFPSSVITRMFTKFFIAEMIERFDSAVAEELRSGSLKGDAWYWDVNDLVVDELRRTESPLLGDNELDGPELSELFYAEEHRCIAVGALKKLGVGSPEIWALVGEPGNGSEEMTDLLRGSVENGLRRFFRDVATADRLVVSTGRRDVVH